jgi:hypothetical protein
MLFFKNKLSTLRMNSPKIGEIYSCGLVVFLSLASLLVLLLSLKADLEFVQGFESGNIFETVKFGEDSALKPTNENIRFATKAYAIDLPRHVSKPVLNKKISDRGLTYGTGLGHKKEVDIGPAAFLSWSILGSTLGHEVEVHCNQSFTLIWLSELFHLKGTLIAERQAYEYEVANSVRFGLSSGEEAQIISTKEYFYPIYFLENKKPNPIDILVAKLFLSSK